MNGREPCPECSVRDTEKVGRWRFECHSCGHEWRDEEAREAYYEEKKQDEPWRFEEGGAA